jgi:hypothetical protein
VTIGIVTLASAIATVLFSDISTDCVEILPEKPEIISVFVALTSTGDCVDTIFNVEFSPGDATTVVMFESYRMVTVIP